MSLTSYGWSVVMKIVNGEYVSWIEKQHLRKFINPDGLEFYKQNQGSLIGKIKIALYA